MSEQDRNVRIIASVPLNATAAKVLGTGVHYDPKVEMASHLHFDTPPPMRPVPSDAPNLVGIKWGRVTVIGLGEVRENNKLAKKARWVVRCSCGDYEHRTAKAITAANDPDECCQNCYHLKLIQKRYSRLGSKAPEDFKGPSA